MGRLFKISFAPSVGVATTGTPKHIASNKTVGKASEKEGRTKDFAFLKTGKGLLVAPVKIMRFFFDNFIAYFCRDIISTPSPTITK